MELRVCGYCDELRSLLHGIKELIIVVITHFSFSRPRNAYKTFLFQICTFWNKLSEKRGVRTHFYCRRTGWFAPPPSAPAPGGCAAWPAALKSPPASLAAPARPAAPSATACCESEPEWGSLCRPGGTRGRKKLLTTKPGRRWWENTGNSNTRTGMGMSPSGFWGSDPIPSHLILRICQEWVTFVTH